MNLCDTYKIILLFILIGYVKCADKPGDQSNNENNSSESYSDTESDEEDNFDVTETTGQTQAHPPEEKKETKPVKPESICNSLIFMKKNEEGIIVPMDEGEYKQIFEDPYKKKYLFQKNLEMILCDYKVIYEQIPGKPYTSSLTHFKNENTFIIRREGEFIFIICQRKKWVIFSRKRSGFIKLYSQNSKGNYDELGDDSYQVRLSRNGTLRYEFNENVKCTKIMAKQTVVWEKKADDPCPLQVNINLKGDIVLYYSKYYIIFTKNNKNPKYLYKKPRKKRRKIRRHNK
ncbi:SVSP family protein [Theileria parva strain Muguga]|uniref:Theileria-specific sub-telomeric protein, SVSP family n=1 Tax=Theileria parva TaxID=5875 RepID=Q4N130_THEPA|nr:SVSP family protein [Theileria parva strain Muguga]EAN32276.1 SVSP family protein [Theileria parva strain Muguga]|eukprot:XP_764559.1 hypothetical protein [Theileria parva strain Muguga]